jgi:AmiR/NasT family two-component response regulator
VERVAESDGSDVARLTAELDELARYADAQEQKAMQLQVALETRVVIEQAVGMLAERFDLTVATAFDLLRRAARDSRRELRALATEVTLGRSTPTEIAAVRAKG